LLLRRHLPWRECSDTEKERERQRERERERERESMLRRNSCETEAAALST
jgi:hypothetical protein